MLGSRLPARPSPEALQLYVLEDARSLRLVMAIRKMHPSPPFFFSYVMPCSALLTMYGTGHMKLLALDVCFSWQHL